MSIQTRIHMLKAAIFIVEITKMFFNRQRDKQITVYPYKRVLFSNKNNRLLTHVVLMNIKNTSAG